MFSLPFVLWTIQMHPVSRALISFPCCPQCDKNIKYLDINLTFQDSYKYDCYHMLQIYFSNILCKIQRPKIPLILHYLPESEHVRVFLIFEVPFSQIYFFIVCEID